MGDAAARQRGWLPVLIPVLVISVLALVAVTYHLPYYAVGPGPSRVVGSAIQVPAEDAFPPTGQFLLTSVSLRDVTPVEAVRGWLDPDVDVVRARTVIGAEPKAETRRQFDAHLQSGMQFSHDIAVKVAFARLGIPLPDPAPGAPAGPAPFEVKIDTGKLGGESGGLALTLGILDALTGGELTGGHKIAVTGTILIDGTVGDVDGVAQKTAAARSARAEYMLVAPRDFATARAHAGSKLKVLQAENLDQALADLAAIGGVLGAPPTPAPG